MDTGKKCQKPKYFDQYIKIGQFSMQCEKCILLTGDLYKTSVKDISCKNKENIK